jgi:hypothetical protein
MNKMINIALQSVFDHISKGLWARRNILRHGADGFTSHPKKDVLRILIALKNPSSSVGNEPATFESNGKHASH